MPITGDAKHFFHDDRRHRTRRFVRVSPVEYAELKRKVDEFLDDETGSDGGQIIVDILFRGDAPHHPSPLSNVRFEDDGQRKFKLFYFGEDLVFG